MSTSTDIHPDAESRQPYHHLMFCSRTFWTRSTAARRIASWLAVAIVFIGLAWRQHQTVNRWAVNMFMMDQWDFYIPLFEGQSWWQDFDRQHGPHRQGFGMLITRELANWSGWNCRWDAFAVSFTLMAAAGLGMILARRCGVESVLPLAAVPMIFLNIRQYESYLGPANLSHGAMPMLLFMAYCLSWFIRSRAIRLSILSALTFLLIFTGFGLFVGLVAPVLLIVEGIGAMRGRQINHAWMVAGALAAVAFSWGLFAWHYAFDAAVPNHHFPNAHPLQYIYFVQVMLANSFGVTHFGKRVLFVGGLVTGLLVLLCAWHGRLLIRGGVENRRRSVVILALAVYALLYCANTAIGRVSLGLVDGPLAPRYVTLMIPASLAIFLHFASLPSRWLASGLGIAYAVLLAMGTAHPRVDDWIAMRWFHDSRLQWKLTYKATHDIQQANEATMTGFILYPLPTLGPRLAYLEEHHLNLFNEAGNP